MIPAPDKLPRTPAGEGSGVDGREAIARIIYDSLYAKSGGKWSLVEPRHQDQVWGGVADAILAHIASTTAAAVQAEREALVQALRPFAAVAEHDIGEDEADADLFRPASKYNQAPLLTVGDLRRALAALARSDASEVGGK